jgi:ketosteroid isomerase-like protein
MESYNENAINELVQFSEDWDRAMMENDVNRIGSFMADDWVIVATEGGITSKTAFLQYIKPGGLLHDKMAFENFKVEIYGDTGVVVARGTSAGTFKEDAFSYYEWSTSIYRKTGNGWRCVLTMLTPANTSKI